MRILALNCGSSTLKFDVLESSAPDSSERCHGSIDKLGEEASASLDVRGSQTEHTVRARDHSEALSEALRLLDEAGELAGVEAVGHRVVHGGSRFREPVLIDSSVVQELREVSDLAPLHNLPALSVIEAASRQFGPDVPMAAVFDTSFFADLPTVAAEYALPRDLTSRLGVRRFGFHGLAHGYMVQRVSELRSRRPPRLITLQLGSGCSAAAILDGRPVDTSMGFTPLEGLIMSSRCGDIDPALPLYLQSKAGLSADEVESLMYHRSGLVGLSGKSSDMRELLGSDDEDSKLAVEAFSRSVRKYAGAYAAVLNGLDALVFGGGIGERSAEVRRMICDGFGWMGLELDGAMNDGIAEEDTLISSMDSSVEVWVVHVDEAPIIAAETERLVK